MMKNRINEPFQLLRNIHVSPYNGHPFLVAGITVSENITFDEIENVFEI